MPKGNPNPSPSTRFTSESPARGRQKGARDRLTANFLTELAESFEQHGRQAIQAVMVFDTAKYLQIIAAQLPKQVELTRPLDELSDEDLAYLIATLKERVPAKPEETLPAPTVN
jgi:hypothetical protein